jgi:hypothetical protein
MVVENTGNGCRSDLSYLVFERMAELSGCSIIIGHKENFSFSLNGDDNQNRTIL